MAKDQTPVDIPVSLPGHDVEVEVSIRVGDRTYRMYLDPDGISIPGTTQYGPGRDLADAIAEAMHRAVWDGDGTMLPEVSG